MCCGQALGAFGVQEANPCCFRPVPHLNMIQTEELAPRECALGTQADGLLTASKSDLLKLFCSCALDVKSVYSFEHVCCIENFLRRFEKRH